MINRGNGILNKKRKSLIFFAWKEVLLAAVKGKVWIVPLEIVVSLAASLSMVFSIILLGKFFDAAEIMIKENGQIKNLIQPLLAVAGIYVLQEILNALNNILPDIGTAKIKTQIHKNMQNKAFLLPPLFYEDEKILDDIEKAEYGRMSAVGVVYSFKEILIFYLPYLIYLNIYLYQFHILLCIGVACMCMTAFAAQSMKTRQMVLLQNEIGADRRKMNRFADCIISSHALKETRILGAFSTIFQKYYDYMQSMSEKEQKRKIKMNGYNFICKLLVAAEYILVLSVLFFMILKGNITVGIFTSLFLSLKSIQDIIEEMVSRCMNDMAESVGLIKNYYNFKTLSERKGKIECNHLSETIEAKQVYFKYPNQINYQIEDFNISIKSGETIAVVGENGSGKSTLMKLLSGIYDTERGEICRGKYPICDLEYKSVFKEQTALFQDFQKYKMSFYENVAISGNRQVEKGVIQKLCSQYGLKFDREDLLDAPDTMLSKEFGGTDLSGGQWQMVAIMRAAFKESKIIFLDEPTSAIDAEKESDLYYCFQKMGENKITFITTHRLGAARFADRIIVMDSGRLVEQGTHEELLRKKGLYYKMWEAQKKWYVV